MYKILVTGVGAIIGYGIIKSLRAHATDIVIIGTDIYSDAVGKNWCDHFEPGVLASDPEYIYFLQKIITKHSIDLVIPGIEQDIFRIVQDFQLLNNTECRFALNNFDLIQLAADKWKMHCFLAAKNLPVIKTFINGDYDFIAQELGIPFLLKPRRSYASKGILPIDNVKDFNYWKKKLGDNFMVQQIVGSAENEYTTGFFGTSNGNFRQKITFKRKLSGEGATAKAKVCDVLAINSFVDQLVDYFKPIGPTNFQFREHHGDYLLLEINPRISSSASLRTAFGYNEAGMCMDYFLKNQEPIQQKIRSGYALRYIEDLVFHDSDNF